MEKRTILALTLSLAILFGWSMLFEPPQDQVKKKADPFIDHPSEDTRGVIDRRDNSVRSRHTTSQPPDKDRPLTIPAVDKKEVKIETPLYTARFTNIGPDVTSFKLKDYRQSIEPEAPLIELVNSKKTSGSFLTTWFDTLLGSDRAAVMTYQVDRENIHLTEEDRPENLIFHSTTPEGLIITQTFMFYPDQYRIDQKVEVVNRSVELVKGCLTTKLSVTPPEDKGGYYSYVGFALLKDDSLEEVDIEEDSDSKAFEGRIDWFAYEDNYFITAVIPDDPSNRTVKGRSLSSGQLEAISFGETVLIHPSEQVSSNYTLYLGPRDLGTLKQLEKKLERAIDLGWTDIIARPLLYFLRFINNYVNNYGISIIVLTILVKMLFWPLTRKSYLSMKEMQKLQPIMTKLREKHKGNREQMNREMMALYKTYKVNPMGGCLPMIIQLPVFFALFRVLGSAIELRHAPFMLWINDLSAPDRLFSFSFSVPFMTPPWGVPVLTLLMGVSMFIQQKMTPTPGDPAQAKLMMFLPVIFTFMFINFPSGLVLYWLVNNILSISQQYFIQKRST
jgi:YidC/Oxa1 family membrane protein insertase